MGFFIKFVSIFAIILISFSQQTNAGVLFSKNVELEEKKETENGQNFLQRRIQFYKQNYKQKKSEFRYIPYLLPFSSSIHSCVQPIRPLNVDCEMPNGNLSLEKYIINKIYFLLGEPSEDVIVDIQENLGLESTKGYTRETFLSLLPKGKKERRGLKKRKNAPRFPFVVNKKTARKKLDNSQQSLKIRTPDDFDSENITNPKLFEVDSGESPLVQASKANGAGLQLAEFLPKGASSPLQVAYSLNRSNSTSSEEQSDEKENAESNSPFKPANRSNLLSYSSYRSSSISVSESPIRSIVTTTNIRTNRDIDSEGFLDQEKRNQENSSVSSEEEYDESDNVESNSPFKPANRSNLLSSSYHSASSSVAESPTRTKLKMTNIRINRDLDSEVLLDQEKRNKENSSVASEEEYDESDNAESNSPFKPANRSNLLSSFSYHSASSSVAESPTRTKVKMTNIRTNRDVDSDGFLDQEKRNQEKRYIYSEEESGEGNVSKPGYSPLKSEIQSNCFYFSSTSNSMSESPIRPAKKIKNNGSACYLNRLTTISEDGSIDKSFFSEEESKEGNESKPEYSPFKSGSQSNRLYPSSTSGSMSESPIRRKGQTTKRSLPQKMQSQSFLDALNTADEESDAEI